MSTEQNRILVQRFLTDGWGTKPGWKTVWNDVFADNVTYHFNSNPEPVVGLDANKDFNESLFKGFPKIAHTVEDILFDGDKVVYRGTMQGAQTGEFLGIPATGKSVRLNDFTMLRIADSKIVEWWYDCNLLALMQQLGVDAL